MIKGKLIVFSAPSGSGKTTIVRHLLAIEKLNLEIKAAKEQINKGLRDQSLDKECDNRLPEINRDAKALNEE